MKYLYESEVAYDLEMNKQRIAFLVFVLIVGIVVFLLNEYWPESRDFVRLVGGVSIIGGALRLNVILWILRRDKKKIRGPIKNKK